MKSAILFLLAGSLYAEAVREPSLFIDFSFENVREIVEKQGVQHVAELLPLLPRDFMASYTLVYKSRGLQESSEMNPRALVFGRTGKFILAFNGDPSQRNFDTLEMMQFREDTKEFELRRIVFADGKVEISDRNPKLCLRCHGERPHPIWNSYPKWPGVYEEADEESNEGAAFFRFLAAQNSHPLYKSLFRHIEINKEWPLGWDSKHVHRPNNRLGRFLGGLAAQSTSELLLKSPFYSSHPNTVLYHLLRCDSEDNVGFAKRIDDLFKIRFPIASFPKLYTDLGTIAALRDQTTFKMEKLILDSDQENWNLALGFEAGGTRYTPDGFEAPSEHEQIEDMLSVRVMNYLSQTDAELRSYFKPWSVIEKFDFNNNPGYANHYVVPYGIADAYQEVNLHARLSELRRACEIVEQRLKLAD